MLSERADVECCPYEMGIIDSAVAEENKDEEEKRMKTN